MTKVLSPGNEPASGRKAFWLATCLLGAVLLAGMTPQLPRPFSGLHSWLLADGPWFARAHVRYGLGYTKGVVTVALGYPPPAEPKRYMDHPPLNVLLCAGAMWVFGVNSWALRLWEILLSVCNLLVIMGLLWRLMGPARAVFACLIWALMPVDAYFGTGGMPLLTGLVSTWLYLVLIRALPGGSKPGKRHMIGMAFVLLFMIQLGWTCFFYVMAIIIHYITRCIFRRQRPSWLLLGVLIVPPLISAAGVFTIMLAGFDWDFNRIIELYKWRAAKGEMTGQMAVFDWGRWLARFWQFAVLNFSWPVLLLAIGGVAYNLTRGLVRFDRHGGDKNGMHKPRLFEDCSQLWLLAMPGILQLLILRGALWPHQYWERPLAPFIAAAAGIGIVALRDALAALHKKAGAALTLIAGLAAAGLLVWVALWADQANGHDLLDGIVSFWPQESWQTNLSLLAGAVLGLAVLVHWVLARKREPFLARAGLAVVLAVCGYFLVIGTNYYYAIRWQNPARIAMWQELNRLIPPNKDLTTFDPVLDNLMATQSEAKGEVMRGEPAWYIDRPILRVPSKDEADETYRQLAGAYAKYVRMMNELIGDYRQGVIPAPVAQARQRQAEANLRQDVRGQVLRDLPKILARLDANRREAPIYLLPGALYQPQLGAALMLYLDEVKQALDKRYALVYFAPEKEGQRDRNDGFFKAGMVPYYVYDVTKGRQESTTSPQP